MRLAFLRLFFPASDYHRIIQITMNLTATVNVFVIVLPPPRPRPRPRSPPPPNILHPDLVKRAISYVARLDQVDNYLPVPSASSQKVKRQGCAVGFDVDRKRPEALLWLDSPAFKIPT